MYSFGIVETHLTQCQNLRKEVTHRGLLGAYIPQCDAKGDFKTLQCHGSSGYCWCVDQEGREVGKSRQKLEKPDCEAIMSKKP